MADFGVAVIGAGVVGLAVARRLAADGTDVVVLERRERHGQETSSRNSEVIHAGIYYPEGSLKARLCVEGNRRLYELCAREGIAHARLGKVITAVAADERPALDAVRAKAAANGVALEPRVSQQRSPLYLQRRFGLSPDQYTAAQLRYDLLKLQAKGWIRKLQGKTLYVLTPKGMVQVTALVKLNQCLNGALGCPPSPAPDVSPPQSELQKAYRRVRTDLQNVLDTLGIAP